MREALVSIIIDNYNYARFLPQAIDSALGQTYPNVEVIVVDDGSTDQSRDVIASYEGRIVPVFKRNGGMASAYNAGFARSQGDIVVILDSDDVLLPNAVQNALVPFDDPNVVKVHWHLYEIDGYGNRTGRLVPATALPDGSLREALITDGPHACASSPTSGNAWRRSFLETVLPVPEEEFRQAADSYLFTLAPLFGSIRSLDEPQALYRVHGSNDYAHKPAREKNQLHMRVYGRRCAALSKYLAALGISREPETWQEGNPHYAWMSSLEAATDELERLTAEGDVFILADEAHWGYGGGTDIIPGRATIPFPERDGQYWGRPADSADALHEFERLHGRGAKYMVFAWPTFWWLDYYVDFSQHLDSHFPRIVDNERMIVFDLGVPRSG